MLTRAIWPPTPKAPSKRKALYQQLVERADLEFETTPPPKGRKLRRHRFKRGVLVLTRRPTPPLRNGSPGNDSSITKPSSQLRAATIPLGVRLTEKSARIPG